MKDRTKPSQADDFRIIYDSDCPMCNWYTGTFINHGFLSENGREAYQNIGPYTKTCIDMNRARNHIALLNKKTGKITYGIDSLVEILSSRWKWIKTVATSFIVAPFLRFLYDFISYNRKVIAPSANRGFLSCIPDFNLTMRLLFILVCGLGIESWAGNYFSNYFDTNTRWNGFPLRETLLFISQLLFQGLVAIAFTDKKNTMDYLGHLSFVSLIGAFFLFVFHILLSVIPFQQDLILVLSSAGLGAVLMFMFIEHKRRIMLLGYPKVLSYSWVLFRIILFFVIFKS